MKRLSFLKGEQKNFFSRRNSTSGEDRLFESGSEISKLESVRNTQQTGENWTYQKTRKYGRIRNKYRSKSETPDWEDSENRLWIMPGKPVSAFRPAGGRGT
jgi:hypothetical protein